MSARLNFADWVKQNKDLEDLKSVEPSQYGELNSEYIDYVSDHIYNESVKSEEGMKSLKDNLKSLTDSMKKQGEVLTELKGSNANSEPVSRVATKEQVKTIVDLAFKAQGTEFAFKATTTTASVNNNGYALDLTDIGQLATKNPSFYEYMMANGRIFPMGMDNNGTVRYIDWDQATIQRAAATITEGGVFPESTAAFETYTTKLKKIGDTLPWTDEFEYDDNFLMQEIREFIRINVRLEKADQLINGDGTGNNLDGIINSSPTYVPTAQAIADASIYDLVVDVKRSIRQDRGSKYMPNFALMNSVDIQKYKLKKDANNNYVMPPFVSADGMVIDSVVVIEDNNVTANQMVMGDINYARMYQAQENGIEVGYINTDFTQGIKRMRLYERCLFLIREVDKTGFLHVADIGAALITLAS